jgi:hypothetical protein
VCLLAAYIYFIDEFSVSELICFFLSVYGNLPSESQLADWEFAVSQHSAVPQGILVCFSFFLIEI